MNLYTWPFPWDRRGGGGWGEGGKGGGGRGGGMVGINKPSYHLAELLHNLDQQVRACTL